MGENTTDCRPSTGTANGTLHWLWQTEEEEMAIARWCPVKQTGKRGTESVLVHWEFIGNDKRYSSEDIALFGYRYIGPAVPPKVML